MAVDLKRKYWNESERANGDIYDDFKFTKPFGPHDLYVSISAL